MKCDMRKKYNELLSELEHCRFCRQYRDMSDIYNEMERLCRHGTMDSANDTGKVLTYFAPLLEDGRMQLPSDALYRMNVKIKDTLMVKVLYDLEFKNYFVTASKAGSGFRLSSAKVISKYLDSLDDDFCIFINETGRDKLKLKQADIVQITLISGVVLIDKYESPYSYLI